jgi:hypothetical protein
MTEPLTEKQCSTCRFWRAFKKDNEEGRCHRRAPVAANGTQQFTASAIGLLVWWYIETQSNAENAKEQCELFKLNNIEEPGLKQSCYWPVTFDDEWCGEWEAK